MSARGTRRLTVGDTVVLHLQVLVGPRTGVRKSIRAGNHNALGAVITPVEENGSWNKIGLELRGLWDKDRNGHPQIGKEPWRPR